LRAALTSPLVHTPLRMMTRALGRGTGTLATLGEMWRADLAIEDPRHLIWDVSRYGWEDWICRHCNVTPARIIEGRLGIAGVTAGLSILDRAALMTMLADVGATESIWGSLCESAGKLLYYPYGRDALVAYALSISWAERLAEPKRILRQVAEDLGVPRFIITRKKSGFSINPARWAPRGTVFDPFIPLVGSVFPKDELLRLQSPEMQRAMTYWNLINYGLWKRLVVDGHPASRLKDEVREEVQRLEHRQGAGKPTSPR